MPRRKGVIRAVLTPRPVSRTCSQHPRFARRPRHPPNAERIATNILPNAASARTSLALGDLPLNHSLSLGAGGRSRDGFGRSLSRMEPGETALEIPATSAGRRPGSTRGTCPLRGIDSNERLLRQQVTNVIHGRFGISRPVAQRVLELARAA